MLTLSKTTWPAFGRSWAKTVTIALASPDDMLSLPGVIVAFDYQNISLAFISIRPFDLVVVNSLTQIRWVYWGAQASNINLLWSRTLFSCIQQLYCFFLIISQLQLRYPFFKWEIYRTALWLVHFKLNARLSELMLCSTKGTDMYSLNTSFGYYFCGKKD